MNYKVLLETTLINNIEVFLASAVEVDDEQELSVLVTAEGTTKEQALAELALKVSKIASVAFNATQDESLIIDAIQVKPYVLDRDDDYMEERYSE